MERLTQANSMAQMNNIQGSTQIIMEIMNDPARTDFETQSYNKIYNNAKLIYENNLNRKNITPAQNPTYNSMNPYNY